MEMIDRGMRMPILEGEGEKDKTKAEGFISLFYLLLMWIKCVHRVFALLFILLSLFTCFWINTGLVWKVEEKRDKSPDGSFLKKKKEKKRWWMLLLEFVYHTYCGSYLKLLTTLIFELT